MKLVDGICFDIVTLERCNEFSRCSICRLGSEAAEHSVNSFFWENVNDPTVRKEIIRSCGFCAKHSRPVVAKELMESGTVQGVNIIYEQLGRVMSEGLRSASQKEKIAGGLRAILKQFGNGTGSQSGATILAPD